MKNYNRLLFSTLGAAFEYYDLAIYSVFAVTIGSKFFDKSSSISNTLLVFFGLYCWLYCTPTWCLGI